MQNEGKKKCQDVEPDKTPPLPSSASPVDGVPASPSGSGKDVATMDVTQTITQMGSSAAMVVTPDKDEQKEKALEKDIVEMYETESPRKLKRPPLGKTRSAGKSHIS